MFACIYLESDWEISLVLLKEHAMSLGDECFQLLECSLCCHPSRKLDFSLAIAYLMLCDMGDVECIVT